jgi:DNA polymerase
MSEASNDRVATLVSEGKMTTEEAASWEALRGRVERCTSCDLYKTCSHRVFGVGNPKAPFLFVGEAPGAREDLQNEPFVGKSGKYMRKKMQEAGFRKGDVYIANTVMCRPPGNREPTKDEIGRCSMHLIAKLDIIKPRVVVAVGSVALKALCPSNKSAIGSCRGDSLSGYGYAVVPVWHPAFVIRNMATLREREFFKDLRKIYKMVFEDGGGLR